MMYLFQNSVNFSSQNALWYVNWYLLWFWLEIWSEFWKLRYDLIWTVDYMYITLKQFLKNRKIFKVCEFDQVKMSYGSVRWHPMVLTWTFLKILQIEIILNSSSRVCVHSFKIVFEKSKNYQSMWVWWNQIKSKCPMVDKLVSYDVDLKILQIEMVLNLNCTL